MSTNLWTKVNTSSFKTKATLLAIAVGIAPIVAVGTLNYVQVRNTSQRQTVQYQKDRAVQIADKFNRFIFERNGDVETLAAQPVFTNAKLAASTSLESKI